jgi:RNA polymerase sigma-70 factor (ECF subfamily)
MNSEAQWTERFTAERARLRAIALRMLGSPSEADDAVQEVWLRLLQADASQIDNIGGWLTTVISRICLDSLRSRKTHAEVPLEVNTSPEPAYNTEAESWLADSLGPALKIVLATLTPTERVAFVLHDSFGVVFEDIGRILGRTPTAARQLASRARRRVQGMSPESVDGSVSRPIVDTFLAASRSGNLEALLKILAPDVVLRADVTAVRGAAAAAARGAPKLESEIRGAAAVAATFSGRAEAAQAAWIDGAAGAVWAPDGQPRAVFLFEIAEGRIVGIEVVCDVPHLRGLSVTIIG